MQTSDYLKKKNLKRITSLNFFVFVTIITILIFNFIDISFYEFSRSFPKVVFSFFQNIIDPLSDILDPLNVIIICLLIVLLNYNFKKLLSNSAKLNLMEEKSGLKIREISDSFNYYALISKHFFWSLAIAGIACNLMKYVIGVSRPKYFFHEDFDRIDFFNIFHKANSFPSGHTQAAFTLAILIMIYFKKFHLYILCLATLMGISRIFMSMHFPSDIFFGAYLGAFVPVLLYDKFFHKNIKLYKTSGVTNLYSFTKLIYWRIFI